MLFKLFNKLILVLMVKYMRVLLHCFAILKCSVPFFYENDTGSLEQVQQRAMNMTDGLEHFSYEGRLQDLGLFGLEKKRACRDLINMLNT